MPHYVWIVDALFFATLFVGVPAIAVVIGRAAWRGKPNNWDRSMYWTAFAVSTVAAAILTVLGKKMQADVRTWRYLVQVVLFESGALLFGIALGCGVATFAFRRGKGPTWRRIQSGDRNAPR
jgi:hypothetical protein